MIYFIQAGDNGPIKIGFVRHNATNRLHTLQIGHYEPLTLVACIAGSLETEKVIHARFWPMQIRGEWFAPTPELLDFIGASTKVAPSVPGSLVAAPSRFPVSRRTFRVDPWAAL